MKTTKRLLSIGKLPVFLVAAAASLSCSAVEFNWGGVSAQWDNTLGYGVGWRLEKPGAYQIMPGNGKAAGVEATGSSYNNDDGTLNFKKGDIYTHVLKWSTDFEVSYENYGAFFRGRAYYDAALMNEKMHFKPLNKASKDAAGKGAELLDAYVWADYYLGEAPVSLRLGRQVLSWGESTFIQGGINSINPVDAAAFRKPGAEIKEALLPVNMVYTSIGLTSSVSMEAFYQLEWAKSRPDPCGTFFSTLDFVADGCGPVILSSTKSEKEILAGRDREIADGLPLNQRISPVAERLEDDQPKDGGQYGIAFRWYAESLGGTEFGLYHMNIHSRLPYINGVVSNYDLSGKITGKERARINPNARYDNLYAMYQIAYPEDIQITGVSFATSTSGGASISGEITYKPKTPVMWNSFELILAGNSLPYSRLYQQRKKELSGDSKNLHGNLAKGYDELDLWQAQSTFIKTYDRVLGADRLAVVAEAGVVYIPDLPSLDKARYGRSGAYGIGNNSGVWPDGGSTNFCSAVDPKTGQPVQGANVQPANCTDDGYTSRLSGGLRMRALLDFNNAFAGMNVTPKLSLSYDKGTSVDPGVQFINDRLTTALGVKMVYQNQTSFDLAYTNYSGGRYNQLKDRDNISFAATYSF